MDFALRDNEILGILGPSGAGKSSIFKMVTFAMQRTAGDLKLFGRDVNKVATPESIRQGEMSIVYQEDVLWPDLTVDENL